MWKTAGHIAHNGSMSQTQLGPCCRNKDHSSMCMRCDLLPVMVLGIVCLLLQSIVASDMSSDGDAPINHRTCKATLAALCLDLGCWSQSHHCIESKRCTTATSVSHPNQLSVNKLHGKPWSCYLIHEACSGAASTFKFSLHHFAS